MGKEDSGKPKAPKEAKKNATPKPAKTGGATKPPKPPKPANPAKKSKKPAGPKAESEAEYLRGRLSRAGVDISATAKASITDLRALAEHFCKK